MTLRTVTGPHILGASAAWLGTWSPTYRPLLAHPSPAFRVPHCFCALEGNFRILLHVIDKYIAVIMYDNLNLNVEKIVEYLTI